MDKTVSNCSPDYLEDFYLIRPLGYQHSGTRKCSLQVSLGSDLYALGCHDCSVADVGILYAQLPQRLGHEQSTHRGNKWPLTATQHHAVTLTEDSVTQDDINGGAQPSNHLHLGVV